MNPCPGGFCSWHLHVYPVPDLGSDRMAGKVTTPERPRIDSPPARSLRPWESLLSSPPALAGVWPGTSRSIKPRERDLRNRSRLFVCPEVLTRPTRLPRHAAWCSSHQSKPVRPLFGRTCSVTQGAAGARAAISFSLRSDAFSEIIRTFKNARSRVGSCPRA